MGGLARRVSIISQSKMINRREAVLLSLTAASRTVPPPVVVVVVSPARVPVPAEEAAPGLSRHYGAPIPALSLFMRRDVDGLRVCPGMLFPATGWTPNTAQHTSPAGKPVNASAKFRPAANQSVRGWNSELVSVLAIRDRDGQTKRNWGFGCRKEKKEQQVRGERD